MLAAGRCFPRVNHQASLAVPSSLCTVGSLESVKDLVMPATHTQCQLVWGAKGGVEAFRRPR